MRKDQDVGEPSWWEVRAADGPERQATECGMYQSERPRRYYPVHSVR